MLYLVRSCTIIQRFRNEERTEESMPPDASDESSSKRQVYLRCNGKALRTTVDEVVEFFSSCGKPVSVLNKYGEVPVDGELHELVLVSFKKNKAVEKAIAQSGGQLSGREVVIGLNTRPPKRRSGVLSSVRAFVGNLPFDVTEDAVRAHFAECGHIQFVRFATDESGTPRGFCHVIFEDHPSQPRKALEAALALDGSVMLDRAISVGPAEEKPRPQRKRAASHNDAQSKKPRPAEWRHDRAAGLTLPRQKKPWQS
ncbi:hypothetical protein AB1Y20_007904 [Prymnesium parvum]|uniref:RRM domain-containing protein n=1 Tax=Prymnesium parvum TaxID=97485 RepID=A0AB34IV74_PRYPA